MISKKITLYAISILVGALVTLYVSNKTINYLHVESELPQYEFLLFPSDKSYAYKTKSLSSNERLNKIDRAVTACYPEVLSGIVGVNLSEKEDGYAGISTFSYLPPVEYAKYIINWRRSLKYQGYTDGQFEIKPIGGNRYSVTLTLKDSKHVRLHKYRYETDGNTLYDIKPISIFSGFHFILYSIIFIPAFLLSFIILNNITTLNKKELA
jgi:hypothetical protein